MKNKLEINVKLYRLHVLIFWEVKIETIVRHAKKRRCSISDQWVTDISEDVKIASGVCARLGDDNTDIMVWLKKRPKTAGEFGVLYHELFHAVDYITESHNLADEKEARAFLYEFLANECNQYFWRKRP